MMKFASILLLLVLTIGISCKSETSGKSESSSTETNHAEPTDAKQLFEKSEEIVRLKQEQVDYKNLKKASFSELFRRDKCKGECGLQNLCIGKSYTITTVIGDGTFLKSPERLFVSMENDRSEILQIEPDSMIFKEIADYIEANRNSTFSLTGFMMSYEGNVHDQCHTGPLLMIKSVKDVKVVK